MRIKIVLASVLFGLALAAPIHAAEAPRPGTSSAYHSQINQQYSWFARLLWSWRNHVHDRFCGHGDRGGDQVAYQPPASTPSQVPELDGTQAGIALFLLGGLVLLIRETRRAS